jgi:competence protein ComEA
VLLPSAVLPSFDRMRSRSLAAQHDAAVARRLELLSSELAAVRHGAPGGPAGAAATRPRGADSWSPQGHTHIRAVPDVEAEPDDEASPPPPSVARLPGRHASRRVSEGGWSGWVPDQLRGRITLGPGQLAVVAVVAAAGLAVTCWWLVRSAGHQVAAPVALSSPAAALATPSGGAKSGAVDAGATIGPAVSAAPSGGTKVVVDVTGRVRRPGIVVLREGARVVDALRAAGGARPGVALGSLNLARVLTDGEQIVVGQPAPATVPSVPSSVATGPPGATLVNLNTADETALESLPEVGPVTAQAILAWRTEHGGFSSVDQLLDVDGIGDATLAQVAPFVTV